MYTTQPSPTRQTDRPSTVGTDGNPWLLWRPESPEERDILTVAETAECRCPDLCDRDHGND